MKCTVITGINPEGSIADDTDYIRCGVEPAKPIAPPPWDFPMCAEHRKLFTPEKG